MNADNVNAAITAAYPRPSDTFASAKWAGDISDICAALAREYKKEEAAKIRTIQNHGLTSDTYEVQEIYRPYSRVDIPLLKKQEPEIYNAAVHVRNADAVEILGRGYLYHLAAEKLGEKIADYEVVTVTEVKKLLPAADAARYIIDDDEFVKLAVVMRDE